MYVYGYLARINFFIIYLFFWFGFFFGLFVLERDVSQNHNII